jgi:hypothetical protein
VSDLSFVKALALVMIPIVCAVVYHAGRLSQRVDYLQRDVDGIPRAMRDGFRGRLPSSSATARS